MWDLLVGLLLSSVGFFLGAKLLKGIKINDFGHAVIVALFIALLNGTLGVFLSYFTGVLDVITFGFFQFILDAFIIWIAGKILNKFEVNNFGSALLLAIIVAVFSSLSCYLLGLSG